MTKCVAQLSATKSVVMLTRHTVMSVITMRVLLMRLFAMTSHQVLYYFYYYCIHKTVIILVITFINKYDSKL